MSAVKIEILGDRDVQDEAEGAGPIGGRTFLMRSFAVDITDPSLPYFLIMTLRSRNQRLACQSIYLSEKEDGPTVTGTALRSVTVDAYVRRVHEELLLTSPDAGLIREMKVVEGKATATLGFTAHATATVHGATVTTEEAMPIRATESRRIELAEETGEAQPIERKIVLLEESAPGAPSLRQVIEAKGIPSEEAVGTPTVTVEPAEEIHQVSDGDSATAEDTAGVTKITTELVADLYRDALTMNSRRPTADVAERLGISRGHASRMLSQARKEGLLGPATKGQAGEALPPSILSALAPAAGAAAAALNPSLSPGVQAALRAVPPEVLEAFRVGQMTQINDLARTVKAAQNAQLADIAKEGKKIRLAALEPLLKLSEANRRAVIEALAPMDKAIRASLLDPEFMRKVEELHRKQEEEGQLELDVDTEDEPDVEENE